MKEVEIRVVGPGDDGVDRRRRLVALLASGLERLLGQSQATEAPTGSDVDFTADVGVTTDAPEANGDGEV